LGSVFFSTPNLDIHITAYEIEASFNDVSKM